METQVLFSQAKQVAEELICAAKLEKGDLLVVGCSSSEIVGSKIGTDSNIEAAEAVFSGIYEAVKSHGIFLAAQCCEHLNRCLVVEKEYARAQRLEIVNVGPQPKAGGSFATTAYHHFDAPVLVEEVRAEAGLDIGGTLIGMNLKKVAVPTRLSRRQIGEAVILAARTRPKFVGGQRAIYDDSLN